MCLECHNDTQVKGGFGRKLDSRQVIRYRDDWLRRVQERRDAADRFAVSKVAGVTKHVQRVETIPHSEERADAIQEYVNSLPSLRKELVKKSKMAEAASTADFVAASYEYVDALQGILVTLADFYPKGAFNGDDPHRFFSELVASRYAWHRSHAEPHGPGTGGTIVNVTTGRHVVADVKRMIEDMAHSLVGYDDRFNWREWPALWNEAIPTSL